MKIIGFVTEENKRFYDVSAMQQIIGVSRSKVQRALKHYNFSNHLKYKNQYLYSEDILFSLMEHIFIEKME